MKYKLNHVGNSVLCVCVTSINIGKKKIKPARPLLLVEGLEAHWSMCFFIVNFAIMGDKTDCLVPL